MSQTVVIAGFFPPPVTGQALATARLAELLDPSHDIICVNLREGSDAIDFRIADRFVQKFRSYRQSGRELASVLRKNPDATLIWTSISPETFGHWRDLLTIAPSLRLAKRSIAVVHWGRFAKLFESIVTRSTANNLVAQLDSVVFLNDDRAEVCAPWIREEKRAVIPNTLDANVICTDEEVAAKQGAHAEAPALRVLFLSHMIREKGYADVLEAVRLVASQGVNVHATFVGQWVDAADKLAFDHEIQAKRLQDHVTQVGPVTERGHVKQLHLDSDVFVLPSYMVEGQPLAIIEAMNAGTPVISTNIGGMVGMISSGVEGFLVGKQSPDAIADALMALNNPDTWLRQSRAARRRYLEDYSASTVRDQWLRLV